MVEWLQVDTDDEIDVKDIMRQIRTHLAQERVDQLLEDGGDIKLHFSGQLNQELYDALSEAFYQRDKSAVAFAITDTKIPVLGRLLNWLKRKVHQLVIFYVNKSAARQISFNTQLLRAFGAVLMELDESKAEVASLKSEIESLNQRLADSEAP